MRFPLGRRVVSLSDIYTHKKIMPDHKLRFKSQDLALSNLIETSQVLLDERTSAKRFRQLYSHLKFAHTQLQVGYFSWKVRLFSILAEKRELELLCAELQKSALSPETLELIKCEVKNALMKKSEEELIKATEEVNFVKSGYLNATKKLETLKVDYDRLLVGSQAVREEEALREIEHKHMAESQEEVINRLSSLLSSDTETLAALYRENSQISAQYQIIVGEAEKSKRLYDTQMCELKNELIRAIEGLAAAKADRATLVAKCESLNGEMEVLAKNLASTRTDLRAARQRVIDCERARLSLEKDLEARVHCLRSELSSFRLTAQRERVEIERQRDHLAFQVQGTQRLLNRLMILKRISKHLISDLTSQMALALAKFEEVEMLYQQREQEMSQRESDLRKTVVDSTEESRNRSAEILHQLECTQSRLRELAAQHEEVTQALAESETLKFEIQKKLSLSEAQNSALKDELSVARNELKVRQSQIQNLECVLNEFTSTEDRFPEKEEGDVGGQTGEMVGVREAYKKLLEKFRSQRTKLTEKIRQLDAELIAKSYEAERNRQENEKLRVTQTFVICICIKRNCVPQAEYQRVKSQLKEFQRRKESYWFLLHQSDQVLSNHSD
ncbi:unnamed protein product [Hydatigera taeniaeformis]|uniref:Coiled-coil domain-containing protein 18 n=1 Tax=Hydatigena taeniaeformis TaxID=6205 RepID=A0A0R3WJQ0_HYDTA|nr:unnamed protein product [Hydatigera taeniaeformis]